MAMRAIIIVQCAQPIREFRTGKCEWGLVRWHGPIWPQMRGYLIPAYMHSSYVRLRYPQKGAARSQQPAELETRATARQQRFFCRGGAFVVVAKAGSYRGLDVETRQSSTAVRRVSVKVKVDGQGCHNRVPPEVISVWMPCSRQSGHYTGAENGLFWNGLWCVTCPQRPPTTPLSPSPARAQRLWPSYPWIGAPEANVARYSYRTLLVKRARSDKGIE